MIQDFGTLPDGSKVQEVTLKKGRLEAKVLTLGAIIRDLKVDGRTVVLGFDNLENYLTYPTYFGAMVGRCINRIANGRMVVDGQTYQLELNENEVTHVHGGSRGFSDRVWQIEQTDKGSVLLKLISEDGDMSYPGRVEVLVRYTLTGTGALRVKISATTDKTTPVNLSQHSYFNLGTTDTILDHVVEIATERYLPVDENLIPTGDIGNVAWTPHDFQGGRKVRRRPGEEGVIFDHNYCLSESMREAPEFAAAVEDPEGDLRMEVWTNQPGIQFYDAAKLQVPAKGLNGQWLGPHAGLCLEAQHWPDAVNHPGFPSMLLQPGEVYNHITEFRFS